MGKLSKNVFVILGEDYGSKKIQLERIKALLLKESPDLTPIYFTPQELSLTDLQKELQNLSLSKRLFIFKNAELLSMEIKSYMERLLKGNNSSSFYVFDFDVGARFREQLEKDDFFSFLFGLSPPYKMGAGKKEFSLSDLGAALRNNSKQDALIVISSIFDKYKGQKIYMQTLGLIVKVFSEVRDPLHKKKCLTLIFDTDRLIKEGFLEPQMALEILIIKLTSYADNSGMNKEGVPFVNKFSRYNKRY